MILQNIDYHVCDICNLNCCSCNHFCPLTENKEFITAEQALGQLRYKKVNHQICILNQEVIDGYLTFVKSADK